MLFCLKTLFLFIAKCVDAPPQSESKHGCQQRGGRESADVARGKSEGTRPGAQQHTFCSHFKRAFRQKFRPKNA